MILPGRTTLVIAAALAVLLVGAAVQPVLLPVVLLADGALLAAVLLAGRRLRQAALRVERVEWGRLEIDCPTDLVFRVENAGRRAVTVVLRQAWPATFQFDEQRAELRAEPGEALHVGMRVTPRRRGRVTIPPALIEVRSPGDTARRRWHLDDGGAITVYPNLRIVAQYDALRRHHSLQRLGIHRMRMIGSGRDFDQLREYVPDDDYRDIDWKATARRGQPITTVYQAERSQDLLVCLECGRMMGNPIGRTTALDRAVEAAIVLAHVCGRAGDRMGLVCFRDTVTRFIKPAAGAVATQRIIEELVELAPEAVFPSYAALVSALRANHKRRSMVFLFTDLNDPQLAANLLDVLPLVSRRHVLVVVSLRDPLLEQIAAGPAPSRHGLYEVLAGKHLADERQARVRELTRAGARVLEVDADSITVDVINTYLEIKMRQLL